jgi:hypothetical protein
VPETRNCVCIRARARRGRFLLAPALALALVLAGGAPAEEAAPDFGIDALMARLAQTRSARAEFTETRHLAILGQALVSSGELRFTAPDRLEKRTLLPAPETLVLEGRRLRIERPGRRAWNLDLAERPEAWAFIESVRATLAGDRAMLERHYAIELRGGDGGWQLALAPRDEALRGIVRSVRIGGEGDEIRRIDFELPDGDRAEMSIRRVPGTAP